MKRLLNIDEIDEIDRKRRREQRSRNGSMGANARWAKWRAAKAEREAERDHEFITVKERLGQTRLSTLESRLDRIEQELGIPNE